MNHKRNSNTKGKGRYNRDLRRSIRNRNKDTDEPRQPMGLAKILFRD